MGTAAEMNRLEITLNNKISQMNGDILRELPLQLHDEYSKASCHEMNQATTWPIFCPKVRKLFLVVLNRLLLLQHSAVPVLKNKGWYKLRAVQNVYFETKSDVQHI